MGESLPVVPTSQISSQADGSTGATASTITYDQLVAELRGLGIDLGPGDLQVAGHLTAYEGRSVRAILRWVVTAAATGRSR